jgi:transcriptional regulator with PAS, ATPase and Fis domain
MQEQLSAFRLNENISIDQLIQIFNNSYDGIMVTDAKGIVTFANPSCCVYMGIEAEQIVNRNVVELVKKGVYDKSVALQAIEKRSQQTNIVNVANGNRVISTSTPIFNPEAQVVMTITNVRVESLIDKYAEALEKEKDNAARYQTAMNYLANIKGGKHKIIAESPQIRRILDYLSKISKSDSTVLLLGESGTGKDVMSRFVHESSRRSNEPFIPVNCAAIPKDLMESEFFGYVGGAFSGAQVKGKPGFFEMADHGTLFLDEIGEMPLALQSKLLRAIETGIVQRLGDTKMVETDVRIIAATNRDLAEKVRNGTFRADLFYRLNVIPVKIPPLRERKEDILALSAHFVNQYNLINNASKYLSEDTVNGFIRYDWPGNIRELKNVIDRLVIISAEDEIKLGDELLIKLDREQPPMPAQTSITMAFSDEEPLKAYTKRCEKHYIEAMLNSHHWQVNEVADKLGLHRSMLYRKISEYGLTRN